MLAKQEFYWMSHLLCLVWILDFFLSVFLFVCFLVVIVCLFWVWGSVLFCLRQCLPKWSGLIRNLPESFTVTIQFLEWQVYTTTPDFRFSLLSSWYLSHGDRKEGICFRYDEHMLGKNPPTWQAILSLLKQKPGGFWELLPTYFDWRWQNQTKNCWVTETL